VRIKSHLDHFAGRKSYVKGLPGEGILNCALGTNPFGVSEKVLLAARNYHWADIYYYPDPFHKGLRQALTRFWADFSDLKEEQIQIAGGAMAVLERLNKIFIENGSTVLGYSPQFTEYVTEIEASGGRYEAVVLKPEENFEFNTQRLLKMMSHEHCLVYLDNPNNPTGQVISLEKVEEIILEAGKKGIVVIIDEAFGDYWGRRNSAIKLVNKYQNLIVIRTFSKGFGLAALRVGYGVFPLKLVQYYEKVNVPFAADAVGCHLAKEALSDMEFISKCQEMVKREKGKLLEGLKQRGYLISKTLDSCPIFVLGHPDKTLDLNQQLLLQGILTESGKDFRNLENNYARVNIPLKANDFLDRLYQL